MSLISVNCYLHHIVCYKTFLLFFFIYLALLQHKESLKELDAAEASRLQRGQKDHLGTKQRQLTSERQVFASGVYKVPYTLL